MVTTDHLYHPGSHGVGGEVGWRDVSTMAKAVEEVNSLFRSLP